MVETTARMTNCATDRNSQPLVLQSLQKQHKRDHISLQNHLHMTRGEKRYGTFGTSGYILAYADCANAILLFLKALLQNTKQSKRNNVGSQ